MPEVDPQLIIVHVREMREQCGLTLRRVAQESGIPRASLALQEVGASEVSVQDLARLARCLRVNPWHLVTYVGFELPCGCNCHQRGHEVPDTATAGPASPWRSVPTSTPSTAANVSRVPSRALTRPRSTSDT